jgi:hypothetical protein
VGAKNAHFDDFVHESARARCEQPNGKQSGPVRVARFGEPQPGVAVTSARNGVMIRAMMFRKMTRRQRPQHPRNAIGPGPLKVTLRRIENPDDPRRISRTYSDAAGQIEVVCSKPHFEWRRLLEGYEYDGSPLSESWPAWDGTPFSQEIAEMITGSYALASLGIENVRLFSHRPHPDLFATSKRTRDIGIEITTAAEAEERSFLAELREFVAFLNTEQPVGYDGSYTVEIGFKRCPARSEYAELRSLIESEIKRMRSSSVTYVSSADFMQATAQISIQFEANPPSGNPRITGASNVNHRGLPDPYLITLDLIENKKGKDYREAGRENWLVVGLQLHLIDGPAIDSLFNHDIALGQFDRIVLSDQSVVIDFRRIRD